MKVLKYKEDRRCVAIVGFMFCLQVGAWFINWETFSIASILMIAYGFAFLGYLCHCVNHNHIHVPLFKTRNQNNIFSAILSISQGLSSKSTVVTHNLNHHVHTAREGDWFHPKYAGNGPGLVRLLRYTCNTWMTVGRSRKTDPTVKLPKHLAKQELVENVVLVSFMCASLAMNWRAFAYIILPGWLGGSIFITVVNLMQHEGCDPTRKYAHSRNYTSTFGNWVFFNGGYHLAHHCKPSVHWTKLPGLHQEIALEIPEGLEDPSMLGMILKKYLFKFN